MPTVEKEVHRSGLRMMGEYVSGWSFSSCFPRARSDKTVPITTVEDQGCMGTRRWNFGGVSVEFEARGWYRTSKDGEVGSETD